LLDKSHICASMYLSILLDRSSWGDLDRRWDHTVVLLASCGHLGRIGVKEMTWLSLLPLHVWPSAPWANGLRETYFHLGQQLVSRARVSFFPIYPLLPPFLPRSLSWWKGGRVGWLHACRNFLLLVWVGHDAKVFLQADSEKLDLLRLHQRSVRMRRARNYSWYSTTVLVWRHATYSRRGLACIGGPNRRSRSLEKRRALVLFDALPLLRRPR